MEERKNKRNVRGECVAKLRPSVALNSGDIQRQGARLGVPNLRLVISPRGGGWGDSGLGTTYPRFHIATRVVMRRETDEIAAYRMRPS